LKQSPSDWATPYPSTTPSQQHATKKMAISSPVMNRPPVPSWGSLDAPSSMHPKHAGNNKSNPPSNLKTQRSNSTTGPQPLPINLSLSEDERSPANRSSSNDSAQSPQRTKTSAMLLSSSASGLTGQGQSSGAGCHNPHASPMETEDMLYEYFPLSLDDW